MRLDVYDTDATTLLGTLSEVYRVEGLADLRIPGAGSFAVDIASSDDLDLLLGTSRTQTRRWVRFRTGANPGEGDLVFAVIVQDVPADVTDIEPEPGHTITTVTFQCPGALSILGYREGGGLLYPYGGLDGGQQVPRLFGPFGFDHQDETRPEPTTGGTPTREGWPDSRAFTFRPTGDSLYRRLLTAAPDRAGPAAMWLTSAAWTEVEVFYDGRRVPELSSAYGSRAVNRWDIPYDGEDHVIFFQVSGDIPSGETEHSLAWTWASTDSDGEMGNRLFSTFHTDDVDSFTAPRWDAWENYTDFPGVTVGFVLDTVAIPEAKARGEIPQVTTDFDETNDSDNVAWSETIARGFRVQKLGQLVDSLSAFKCEPHMTPAGVLQAFQSRGEDKSASITVTAPFGLAMSGRGVQATRLLYETEGGFGEAINAAQETALGVVMADIAQFGEDLDPDTIVDAVVAQLEDDAKVLNELDIDLPDDIAPGVDVWLGDEVTCEMSLDGTSGKVRLTSFRFEVDDRTGHVEWSATAEPV